MSKGWTLIEALIVVAMIFIGVALIYPTMKPANDAAPAEVVELPKPIPIRHVNQHGQIMEFIHSPLTDWFESHKEYRIISVSETSNRDGNSGWVVIYDRPRVEK